MKEIKSEISYIGANFKIKEKVKSGFGFTWLCESQVRKRLKNLAVRPPSLKKYKKRNLGFTPTPNFGVSLYSKRGGLLL